MIPVKRHGFADQVARLCLTRAGRGRQPAGIDTSRKVIEKPRRDGTPTAEIAEMREALEKKNAELVAFRGAATRSEALTEERGEGNRASERGHIQIAWTRWECGRGAA